MAEKLDDNDLLEILQRKEDEASHYVHGQLGDVRELAMREYHRMPYGNEVDGERQIVASDIQDSVEWILPALLKTSRQPIKRFRLSLHAHLTLQAQNRPRTHAIMCSTSKTTAF